MWKVTQYATSDNLIIKKPLPKVGVICSNPRRVERIISYLTNVVLLKEYQSAWQLDIYTGNYRGKSIFVAAVAVGAAGAAFAIQQMAAAGVKYLLRYGSNDDPKLTRERMHEFVIVDRADNLFGLMQSSGAPSEMWGTTMEASPTLVSALQLAAAHFDLTPRLAICHHVEDYGAYAFPEKAGQFGSNVIRRIAELEVSEPTRLHSRDMETAALFFRSQLDGFHAVTVLQNVPKFRGDHQTYAGEQGQIAKELEKKFCTLIFSVLSQFADEYRPDYRSFYLLSESNVVEYLRTLPSVDPQYQAENLTVKVVSSNNLCNVFQVTNNDTNDSILVKQAVSRLYDGLTYEANYLKDTREITPLYITQVLYSDSDTMRVVIMQDVRKHSTLRHGIASGIRYPQFSQHIAQFIASALFHRSCFFLGLDQHNSLKKQYPINSLFVLPRNILDMLSINSSFNLRRNKEKLFYSLVTCAEVVLHGNLGVDSIMVNQDSTYIIGGNYACMGPMGFDLGKLLGNLIAVWVICNLRGADEIYQKWLLKSVETIMNEFIQHFSKLWFDHVKHGHSENFSFDEFRQYQSEYLQTIFNQAVGFAGLEICRIVATDEMYIGLNFDSKQKAKDLALKIGQVLVEQCNVFKNIASVTRTIVDISSNNLLSNHIDQHEIVSSDMMVCKL